MSDQEAFLILFALMLGAAVLGGGVFGLVVAWRVSARVETMLKREREALTDE